MTTVIDPAGTPVAIFNKEGTAVLDIAINVGPSEPLVPIPHYAHETIARVTVTSIGGPEDGGVELPSAADIGDRVDIAVMPGSTGLLKVYAPAGETIDGGAWANVSGFLWLRKIGPTDWRRR